MDICSGTVKSHHPWKVHKLNLSYFTWKKWNCLTIKIRNLNLILLWLYPKMRSIGRMPLHCTAVLIDKTPVNKGCLKITQSSKRYAERNRTATSNGQISLAREHASPAGTQGLTPRKFKSPKFADSIWLQFIHMIFCWQKFKKSGKYIQGQKSGSGSRNFFDTKFS